MLSTAPRYATTAAGVYMEQCVHALKMRALRPLRETTYLRVQVHVTAYKYVAPAVADAPQRYCTFDMRTCGRARVRGAGARSVQRLSRAPVKI